MKAKNEEQPTVIDQLNLCYFNGTYNKGAKKGTVNITMQEYRDAVQNPDDQYIEQVTTLRKVKRCKTLSEVRKLRINKKILASSTKIKDVYSALKWKSWHMYPSCTFDGQGCKVKNVNSVSGLLVYDLQGVDEETRVQMEKWKHTVAVHNSIGGGSGDYALFLFCPGLSVENFSGMWEKGNELIIANFGIKPDSSDECKDVTRIRYLSYDPNIYYNPYAEPIFVSDIVVSTTFTDEQRAKINAFLDKEPSWYKFGLSLAIAKGETGRELYHVFSKENKRKYEAGTVNKKYDRLLEEAKEKHDKGLSGATFFYLLKEMGVPYVAPRINGRVNGGGNDEDLDTVDVLEYLNGIWVRNEINDKIYNYKTGKEASVETIWTDFRVAFGDPKKFPINTVQALLRSDRMNTINPIKDFMKDAKSVYDGGKYIQKFVDCLPVKDKEATKLFLTYWAINCYNQAMFHETNRTFLIMKGSEEVGKSRALGWFCPLDGYLKTGPLNTDNKDTRIALAHNFLWNDDELKVFRSYDINKIKALISQDTINERAPYSRTAETMKRICSFCGSTNEDELLPSTEGNTRFLVIELKPGEAINWKEYMKIDKRQFWGEVISLCEAGWIEANKERLKDKREGINRKNIINSNIRDAIMKTFESSFNGEKKRSVYSLLEICEEIDPEGKLHAVQKENLVRDIINKEFGSGRTNGYNQDGEQTKGYPVKLKLKTGK